MTRRVSDYAGATHRVFDYTADLGLPVDIETATVFISTVREHDPPDDLDAVAASILATGLTKGEVLRAIWPVNEAERKIMSRLEDIVYRRSRIK